jgi:hypothetical protein
MQCAATRKDGQPCTSNAAINTGDGTLCAGHAGRGFGGDPAAWSKQAHAIGLEKRREKARQRKMTVLDHLAAAVQRDALEIATELRDAGRSGDWRATEALLTRVYGKPVERVEQIEHVDVRQLTGEQRAAMMAKLIAENPGLAELVPRGDRTPADAQTRAAAGESG